MLLQVFKRPNQVGANNKLEHFWVPKTKESPGITSFAPGLKLEQTDQKPGATRLAPAQLFPKADLEQVTCKGRAGAGLKLQEHVQVEA